MKGLIIFTLILFLPLVFCDTIYDRELDYQETFDIMACISYYRRVNRLDPLTYPVVQTIAETIYQETLKCGGDALLIAAIIAQESQFKPTAVSRAGAKGLMQIMPKYHNITNGDYFDIKANITKGVELFYQWHQEFQEVPLTLAAYNAGPTLVRRLKRVPNIRETQHYISNVLHNYEMFKNIVTSQGLVMEQITQEG